MKVLLDIPEEFEIDYRTDRFRKFFERAKAGANIMMGTYERETADVLAKAFEESRPYDLDKVVEQLKEVEKIMTSPVTEDCFGEECRASDCMVCVISKAIEIVKGGGVDG